MLASYNIRSHKGPSRLDSKKPDERVLHSETAESILPNLSAGYKRVRNGRVDHDSTGADHRGRFGSSPFTSLATWHPNDQAPFLGHHQRHDHGAASAPKQETIQAATRRSHATQRVLDFLSVDRGDHHFLLSDNALFGGPIIASPDGGDEPSSATTIHAHQHGLVFPPQHLPHSARNCDAIGRDSGSRWRCPTIAGGTTHLCATTMR